MKMFKEHEQIVLTSDVSGDGQEELKAGDIGTVIHVHPAEQAIVVEFMTPYGETVAIATVLPSQVRPVSNNDIAHARKMTMPT